MCTLLFVFLCGDYFELPFPMNFVLGWEYQFTCHLVLQALIEHRTTSHLDHKRHVVFTMPSRFCVTRRCVISHAFFLRPVHEKRPHDHRPFTLYVYVLDHIWVWSILAVFNGCLICICLVLYFCSFPGKEMCHQADTFIFGVVVDVVGLLPLNVSIQPLTKNLEVFLMSWVFSP